MSVTMTHSHLSRPHTNRINSLLSDKSFQTNSLALDNSLLSDKLSWTDKTNSKLSDKSFQTNFKALSFIKIKAFSLSLSLSSLTKLLVFLSILFLFIGCGGGGGSSNTPTVTTNAVTPVISVQPANASYTKDDTAVSLSITASVTDGGVLSYQWYSNSVNSNENGVLIPEATGQSYIPSTANEGTLYYYVVVTNTNNNVNGEKTALIKSNTAEITVNALIITNAVTPVISVQPANASYTKDDTAVSLSITASVTDGGVLSYQWYSNSVNSNENGVLIPEATGQSYTPSTVNTGTLYYYAVVTNTNNNVNGEKTALVKSNTAEITVNALISYTVKCFDENLDLENTVDAVAGNIDPWDTSICGTRNWYLASSNTPVTSHNLNSDINFYAVANIIEITTQTQLDDIRNNLSGKYILLNDIVLDETGAGFDETLGWNPIGESLSINFNGIFNGDFHKITNLWINRTTTNYVGLFGFAGSAEIKNLGVEGEIQGKQYVGGITGRLHAVSNIANSYFKGNINATSSYVGGIAGYNTDTSTIKNSYAEGNISGTSYVGGIAGHSYVYQMAPSVILNSYFKGNINATSSYVGGITGYNFASIVSNSYSEGTVSGVQYVGGIAGQSSLSVSNSYSTANVSGTNYVGGITGRSSVSNVTNSAAINPSIAGNNYVYRIIGNIFGNPTISNNFALNDMLIKGVVFSGAEDDLSGISKTLADFQVKETYETDLGWSFGDNDDNPWKIDANKNNGLPYFYWQEL